MKSIKILKLKFLYLINKSILLTFFIMCILLVFIFVFEAFNSLYENSYNVELELFNVNSFMYLKLVMVFFSIYLYSYSVSNKNDFLMYLLLPLGVSKKKSIFYTIIVNSIILFIIFIFLFLCYNFIASKIFSHYVFEKGYLFAFFNIMGISMIYGLYSIIFMFVFKNNFVIIFVFALFMLSNNYYDNLNMKLEFYNYFVIYFLPNVNNIGQLYINYLSFIFQHLSTILIIIRLYCIKDLNY